jgi:hypothetical protein
VADKDLQELFKRAAEVAKVVPESMQEAAFHRALDALTGGSAEERCSARTAPNPVRGGKAAPESTTTNPVEQLTALDRSRAPEVDSNDGSLGKGLALLLIARRELGIDGLTPQQMATVLTDKFRWRVTRQAISQAMDAAGNRVDHNRSGRATVYRIMDAGERWLEQPSDEREGEAPRSSRRRSNRGRAKTKSPNDAAKAAPGTPDGAKRKTARGPKQAVQELIAAGWFSTPRGLGEIRAELANRMALRFTANDLSPTVIRLLREKKLRRSKAESGQYEYSSE